MKIPPFVKQVIALALEEDVWTGDITSRLIPEKNKSTARITAKGDFIIAGLPFAREVFHQVDKELEFKPLVKEGSRVKKGTIVARVSGNTRALLAGERTALNILQHLSGIATFTNKFVREVKGTRATILDTRKTNPCQRYMEKYAVKTGGGANHRMGLYDAVLIKDNHIKAAEGIKKAIYLARAENDHLRKIEVEVENLSGLDEALRAGADIILLDNMDLKTIADAVKRNKGRALLEVSGNVTLETVRELALTGVDFISVGAITHSAPAADLSMKF